MKLAGENYLTAYARRGETRLKILRIPNPYGMRLGSRQQGFMKALQCDDQFTINIGSGQHYSLNDIVKELGHHFDLTDRIVRHEGRPIDVPHSVLNIALAREKLHWSPPIPLARGIALAVKGE